MLKPFKTLYIIFLSFFILSACQNLYRWQTSNIPYEIGQDDNYQKMIEYIEKTASSPKEAKKFTNIHNSNLTLLYNNYVIKPNFKAINAKAIEASNNIEDTNIGLEERYDLIFSSIGESLDLHTDWLTSDDLAKLNERISGEYVGIGAVVMAHENGVLLQRLYKNGGAYEVGIKKGDIITEVDGQKLKGKSVDEIVPLLKGRPKTKAKVRILRGNENLYFEVPRRQVHIEIISSKMLKNDIGYIALDSFNGNSDKELLSHFQNLRAKGANKLILDLRGNPGGLLNEAIYISDIFLPKGKNVVSIKARKQRLVSNFSTRTNDSSNNIPLIVLIDEGSASASEIVAGALKDHGRAMIVGRRSFGKGTVQQVIPIQKLGALKITYALYESPKGGNIQASGITPHIIVETSNIDHEIMRAEDIEGSIIPDNRRQDKALETVDAKDCPSLQSAVSEEEDQTLNCAIIQFTKIDKLIQ